MATLTDVSLSSTLAKTQLSLADVMCPICLSILVEPVTLPCSHSLCRPCFNQHLAKTSLECPICRRRISVWVRHTAKAKRLVNTKLWKKILENFADKVEARLHGVDDSDTDEKIVPVHHVSAPGEIRQEYEALLAQQLQEAALEKSQEELASNKLIQQLQEEEKMQLRERRKQQELMADGDAAVAEQVKEAEREKVQKRTKQADKGGNMTNKSVATPRGPMDVYIDKMEAASQDINTPTTSTSILGTSSTSSSRLHILSKILNNRSDRLDYGLGRQLREITSQSSESEPEDTTLASPLRKRRKTISMFGKENMQKKKKNSICVCEKEKGKLIANKTYNSPDIDSFNGAIATMNYESIHSSPDIDNYNGVIGVNYNHVSEKDEDSDETDSEELDHTKSHPVIMGDDSNLVGSYNGSQVNGHHKILKGNTDICHSDESDDNQIERVSEAYDIPACNQSLEWKTLTDITPMLTSQEGNPELLAALVAEQCEAEARLKQEAEDHLLAETLQREFNKERKLINRSRGSEDEYKLRNRKNSHKSHKASSVLVGKSSQKKNRQPTLKESMAKHCRTK
ncbi:E3 ubiquitin-protein ligase RNF168 isoform X5 [Cherax quadricarinatus]|uniref:E3 ubiquitin-protein ligase RNF168 isoform X5 n=1 Tax=Cherax quadricarinatus TaxID=27406 RepID=UPI00387ED78F